MRIHCIGGGPAGLFLAILAKRRDPSREVIVVERNRPDDTFGFGVVFSDATLDHLELADAPTLAAIRARLAHWDDIHVEWRGTRVVSTGHGFSGLSRQALLDLLQARARELGVVLRFELGVEDPTPWLDCDLLVAADGVNSALRSRWESHFAPAVDQRPNRFAWLGTTFPFEAFTFWFAEAPEGLYRVHAYRYGKDLSTFILECREETWRAAGLDRATEQDTLRHAEALFRERLQGHRLLANRSVWRRFPTIRCARWWARVPRARGETPVVLLGDAAHTAHFSIGSGTKLALEDAISLADALDRHADVGAALAAYEAERRPGVEQIQRAAEVSLRWFEETERYIGHEPLRFAFSLLTRSLRVTHDNLKVRDPALVARVDELVAREAERQAGVRLEGPAPPPMFTPFRIRDLVLPNRVVVSPMCMYSAVDGVVGDFHLVHLGTRAQGGAALVIAEMTDVAPDARISPGCAGLWDERHVAAWRRITDFVHRETRARIGIQLGHAGRKGATTPPWEGEEPLPEGGWPLVSASPLPWAEGHAVPMELDRRGMDRVREQFVRSTQLAVAAGFDWLELHMAHGYLLASFLSPLTNRRTDEHGGPVENRLRFPLEVLSAVRAVWPAERPLSVRISATDWHPEGLDPDDLLAIARALHRGGADLLDVSTGQTDPACRPVYGRLYQTPFAELIRLEAGVPTMTVGNLQSWSDANGIIAAGRADLCVLARAHLYDPYWTHHAARDQGVDLPWPPQYRSVARYTPRFR